MKTCPECEAVILAAADVCPDCGHDFEIVRERKKHDAKPLAAPLLSSDVSDWLPVTRVEYRRHTKPGSPDSLRVDYVCGLTRYSDWVCFEHGGYAAAKAARWWLQRAPDPVPTRVGEALARVDEVDAARAIRIRKDGQYWRVVQVRFA
jgi:DNA repair protein RadD